jgi:hypothetical protein
MQALSQYGGCSYVNNPIAQPPLSQIDQALHELPRDQKHRSYSLIGKMPVIGQGEMPIINVRNANYEK